jgi:carbon storage regulator
MRLPIAPGFVGYNSKEFDISARSKEGSAMLVLSRKLGEKIVINDNICITVVDIDRGKIRLGIEAPREVPIFRQELLPAQQKPLEPSAVVVAR